MERSNEQIPLQSADQFDERFFVSITNPTALQLTKYAELLSEDMTKGKPIQFFGDVPYWISPSGIVLAEQFGIEPKQWVMMKQDVVESLSPL